MTDLPKKDASENTGAWTARLAGPAIITATLLVLVIWTWGRLLDPIIDFGRELYVPWQLMQGKVLYRDINSFYGPLSPWVNAAIFRVFSPTVLTLMLANTAILWGVCMMLYALLAAIGTRFSATVAVVMFLAICGTGHLIASGNFNFITPYSHEATHGFALSIAAIVCFFRYWKTSRSIWMYAAGGALGLVFLTKPELFVAAAGALLAGAAILGWMRRGAPGGIRLIFMLLAGALIPTAMTLVALAMIMPWELAWRGTLGSWTFLGNAELTHGQFYSFAMGFTAPTFRLMQAGQSLAWILLLLVPGVLAGGAIAARSASRRILMGVFGAAAVGVISLISPQWELWSWMGNSLLILIPALVISQVIELIREHDVQQRETRMLRIILALFAALLLLKLGLNPRFMDYGFVLSGPAMMLLAIAAIDWAPGWLEGRKFSGAACKGAALAVLAGIVWVHLGITAEHMAPKTIRVGEGANTFYMDGRAGVFSDALHFLSSNTKSADTFTCVPEGAMLNFLARRASPARFVSFVPSDFTMYGEAQLLASLKDHPPEYVVLVHRLASEYGMRRFGVEYGSQIARWMVENYEPAHLSGAVPFSSDEFGILIVRRR